jgi:predicted aspartyl protease
LGVEIRTNKVRISALIDTGADLSLLRYDVFKQIRKLNDRIQLIKNFPRLTDVHGNDLHVLGVANLTIGDNITIDVVIVNGVKHEMILGAEALDKGGAVIDYGKGHLKWYGKKWQILKYMIPGPQINLVQGPFKTGWEKVDKVLSDYADVFSSENEPLGCCDLFPLEIDTGNARPIRQRPYRTPLPKREEISRQIDEQLASDVI